VDLKTKRPRKNPLIATATAFVASYTDRNIFFIDNENEALSLRRLRISGYLISMGTVNPQPPIIGNPLHPIVATLGFKKHLTSHFVHNREVTCQPPAEAVQTSY
jgi:hypothetical protein